MKRVKMIFVTPQVFCEYSDGPFIVTNGLPRDARCIGAGYDHYNDYFWMHVESESFPEVAEGAAIEVIQGPTISVMKVEK